MNPPRLPGADQSLVVIFDALTYSSTRGDGYALSTPDEQIYR